MEGCGSGCTHRDDEPHDDPGPMDGVEDEDKDVVNDPRRAPSNGGQRDPDDGEDEPLSDPDV